MNPAAQPVEIIGGGLAGLALGRALRRAAVPVTLFEAGEYPRQRVCGEFLTGLDDDTVERLDLEPMLAGAVRHDRVAWFDRDRLIAQQKLPQPARAISRWLLDSRLAEAFAREGGHLVTGTRRDAAPRPGRVIAAGRRRAAQPWIGLKMHVRGMPLAAGLEMHLGQEAYVGLCQLADGETNICGLFRRQGLARRERRDLLAAYLEASGLGALAGRVAAAQGCAGSEAAVAGMGFGKHASATDELALGDARCTLPPLLGNGMAAAFQMAIAASAPLVNWSRRRCSWTDACEQVQRQLQPSFRLRVELGTLVHRFLLSPVEHGWLAGLARAGCVPFGLLYRLLH
ncbi:MAG TPA: NAD(P)-binding protein [Lacunisphaera sp.]|nr:NAD(P)-binding protein [Lacunisphaera sp.]